ncbi:MAG: pentapeptide repeat-containing protein, partial [Paracoccaceae bacterium]
TLETGAMVLNFLLTWGFGLVILWFLWTMSWPARTFWMTSIAGVSFGVSIVSGASSLAMMGRRMLRAPTSVAPNLWGSWIQTLGLVIGICAILYLSYQKTAGPADKLAPLSMSNENIVLKPAGWLPYDIARADFLAAFWCKREAIKDCKALGDHEAEFESEWRIRRNADLADMRRPDWAKSGKPKPDFRGADLSSAFLSGADFRRAQMMGGNLSGAHLEGAVLSGAQMQAADISEAQMLGVDLSEAQMERADLSGARMRVADLSYVQLQEANLREAKLQGAVLKWAQLQGANLDMAELQRADLSNAQMQGASFSLTQMEETTLADAQLQKAALRYTQMTGTSDHLSVFTNTNLNGTINRGGMLRFVDLRLAVFDKDTDFRNTFLDGTVKMTESFRNQMGSPCQWVAVVLDEAEFYGRWRGWSQLGGLEDDWQTMSVPDAYREIDPINPPLGCAWKTGPMLAATPE